MDGASLAVVVGVVGVGWGGCGYWHGNSSLRIVVGVGQVQGRGSERVLQLDGMGQVLDVYIVLVVLWFVNGVFVGKGNGFVWLGWWGWVRGDGVSV